MCDLTASQFKDEDVARDHIQRLRWPNGPVCPHCGNEGGWKIESKRRAGLYKCAAYVCGEQFTVTVGTVFERSKIPLTKWLLALHLLCNSKKGVSSHQLHRMLGVTYKTAWFMTHRIRLAMSEVGGGLMGSGGNVIEAKETHIGRKRCRKMKAGPGHKEMVFSLVERDGKVRSVHISGEMFNGIKKAPHSNVSPDARLAMDDARIYGKIAEQFAEHLTLNHSADKYRDGEACTNTIEGFFSVFKCAMTGVYQHCSSDHNDAQRATVGGKRLTYRESR